MGFLHQPLFAPSLWSGAAFCSEQRQQQQQQQQKPESAEVCRGAWGWQVRHLFCGSTLWLGSDLFTVTHPLIHPPTHTHTYTHITRQLRHGRLRSAVEERRLQPHRHMEKSADDRLRQRMQSYHCQMIQSSIQRPLVFCGTQWKLFQILQCEKLI